MKILFLLLLVVVGMGGCGAQISVDLHPMPKMGMHYVHFFRHSDSAGKIVYDSAGNYKKEWKQNGGRVIDQAFALDRLDDSIYRIKYHFLDYYYMWNCSHGESTEWGENTITVDHKPTAAELKDYVWNTIVKFDGNPSKYKYLEIEDISMVSDRNSLGNMSLYQRQEISRYQSIHKQLNQ